MDADQEKRFRFRARLEAEQGSDSTDNAVSGAVTSPVVTPPVEADPLKQQMADQSNANIGNALSAGIAKSAMKTVRGLGTTLLPKSLEPWAEAHGMPSARDMELIDAGVKNSKAAQTANLLSDVATDALPIAKGMSGASTLKDAALRAAGLGGVISGVRAEPGETAKDTALGAVGGLAGEVGGRALVHTLGQIVKPSANTVELMGRNVVPTLGEGVDQSRLTGKALNFLENQLETMPATGYPIRSAKRQAANQLFAEAADTTIPGAAQGWDKGNQSLVDHLLSTSSDSLGSALRTTPARVPSSFHQAANDKIDRLASQYGVSDSAADAIKMDLNKRLWAGVRDEKTTGSILDNVANDLYAGTPATKGNSNAQNVSNEMASGFKKWVDTASELAGTNVQEARLAAANAHVLRRAGVTENGLSGDRLAKAVRSNDASLGITDTATRELQDLGELGSSISTPRTPFGNRNLSQLGRDVIGSGSELGIAKLTGGLGNAAALAYGLVNNSPVARRLLMGDPTTRAAIIKALSPNAVNIGMQSMPNTKE